jgi:homoserine dehydrogenase
MKLYNLCFIGFGNVGRALARLLAVKSDELKDLYGISWRITGIASRRIGWLADNNGFDISQIVAQPPVANEPFGESGLKEWLKAANADVVFETTSLNHESGEPALSYLRAALQSGAHAITANKGALVHGYHELDQLARAVGNRFMFESAVLDSAPVFSLFR